MRVAINVGNEAPTHTALNALSSFHATVNGPAASTRRRNRPPYNGQFRFGSGSPAATSLKKRRSSGSSATAPPKQMRIFHVGKELAAEDMTRRHVNQHLPNLCAAH